MAPKIGNLVHRATRKIESAASKLGHLDIPDLHLPNVGGWLPRNDDYKAFGASGQMAPLPRNASPLMRGIYAAVEPVLGHGTVPGALVMSSANRLDPQIQIEGPAIFKKHAEAIRGARAEVLFETFVWESGSEPAKAILQGLKDLEATRRAERDAGKNPIPVQVKMLVNEGLLAKGGYAGLQQDLAALNLDPSLVKVETHAKHHLLQGALHAKSLMVDRQTGILTGANPQAHHNSKGPWFDLGFQLDGAAVKGMAADFAYNWHQSTGEELGPLPRVVASAQLPTGNTPVLIATRRADGAIFSDGPKNPMGQAFLAAIGGAKKVVRMQTPNLNDPELKRALIDAARRGVKVELVLSKGFNDKSKKQPFAGGTNEENAREMLATARKLGLPNFQIRWFSEDGKTPVLGNGMHASHAKLMIVDDQVTQIGSGNGDKQSQDHSQEVNAFVDSAAYAKAVVAQVWPLSWERGIPAK
jgi:phosphatidylserine/phosphatidylglycerophosphate/cardiolipin synthase-like enzyme